MSYILYNGLKSTGDSADSEILSHPSAEKIMLIQDALAAIDRRNEHELSKLEQSGADEDLKDFIKNDILSKHNDRRLPYVKALEGCQS
jgi:hypothetical protein